MVCRLQSETKRWRKSRCNATWKFAGNNQLWKPRRITYACSEYCYSRGKIIWPEVCSMRESTGEAAAWPTEYFLAQKRGFGKEVGLVEGLEWNCLCLLCFSSFPLPSLWPFPFQTDVCVPYRVWYSYKAIRWMSCHLILMNQGNISLKLSQVGHSFLVLSV